MRTEHREQSSKRLWPCLAPVLALIAYGSGGLAAQGEAQKGGAGQEKAAEGPHGLDRGFLIGDPGGAGRPRLRSPQLVDSFEIGDTEVRIGGYVDFEYRDVEDAKRRFRFHRLVPLIEARVSERVRFQTEIEIEDGGDVGVEFAHLDYEISKELNLRGGVILLPLGFLNLNHDSPIQELTDRPLMHRSVIPTTLRDSGAGIFGRIPVQEDGLALDYELYVISGFRGEDDSGYLFSRGAGLRNGRPHRALTGYGAYQDNNNSLATVFRTDLGGPGFEFGISGYRGSWDRMGKLDLHLGGFDAKFSPSAIEALADTVFADWDFLVEGAYGKLQRDAAARSGGVPGWVRGFYAQLGWKLHPGFLYSGERPYFEEAGRLTLLARMGRVDLDGARQERYTLGFNLRPNADRTVLKFEYQWNREGGSRSATRNDAFVVSLATYF